MNSELNGVLKIIKQKTNIDINAFSETMKFCVSTDENIECILPSRSDFSEVFCDEKLNRTFFKFRFRNADLFGSILGCGEVEKNYAYFILSYLENSSNKDVNVSKSEYIKSIVSGDCSRQQVQKYMRKYNIPDKPCFALVINAKTGKSAELMNFMENYNNNAYDIAVLTDDMNCAFIKVIDDGTLETQSTSDFANILVQSLFEETGLEVKVGIGCTVANFLDINVSYVQANSALRMSNNFKSKASVHSYKEYIWIKMLEEIPKFKIMEYLDILVDKEAKAIFSDEDMLSTAEEFLDNSLNVSETSRKLFMHRNTLMYRLEKIERETGLNIKKFPDAVTFRLITVLSGLINVR